MKLLKIYVTLGVLACSVNFAHTAVFFPSNSAYGIFAAIAVPLDLPHRNVFVSYNFEANYNLPQTWGVPPYATGVEDEDLFTDAARFIHYDNNCSNCTTSLPSPESEEIKSEADTSRNRTMRRRRREMPSLLTRKHFYQILINNFKRHGFEGEPCLLRLICETNASELGEMNGVLGNLIHVMFSPTTSKDENLPLPYYQAEVDGVDDRCHHYEQECSESILDLISTPIYKIIEQMEMSIATFG